jgi:hypothetical protein
VIDKILEYGAFMENTNKGETKYWEKNLSQCLSTPEIPHRLGWE